MKTPRVTDFDPDAKLSTLKSSMANMPSIQKPTPIARSKPTQNLPSITPINHQQQPSTTKVIQPPRQSAKRSYVRRTFDFYEDQIAYLTRQSLQARLAGKALSMNEIIRQALDDWINKNSTFNNK